MPPDVGALRDTAARRNEALWPSYCFGCIRMPISDSNPPLRVLTRELLRMAVCKAARRRSAPVFPCKAGQVSPRPRRVARNRGDCQPQRLDVVSTRLPPSGSHMLSPQRRCIRRGQPRGSVIPLGCSCLAILPPALLRLGTAAHTAGRYGPSHAPQESLDQRTTPTALTHRR